MEMLTCDRSRWMEEIAELRGLVFTTPSILCSSSPLPLTTSTVLGSDRRSKPNPNHSRSEPKLSLQQTLLDLHVLYIALYIPCTVPNNMHTCRGKLLQCLQLRQPTPGYIFFHFGRGSKNNFGATAYVTMVAVTKWCLLGFGKGSGKQGACPKAPHGYVPLPSLRSTAFRFTTTRNVLQCQHRQVLRLCTHA